jgi:hypothetical protein
MSLFSVYSTDDAGQPSYLVRRSYVDVVATWLRAADSLTAASSIGNYKVIDENTGETFEAIFWLEEYNRQMAPAKSLANSLNYLAQFMPKFYKMDPSTDDLLPSGDHLANGMKVLIESPNNRVPIGAEGLSDWKEDRALENNRWCTVESLRIVRETLRFIGVYEDGTKRMRAFPVEEAWYVKRDSIQEITAKYQKVFDTVRLAVAYHETLIKQDGDLVEDVTGNIEETTRRLMEIL